MFENLTESQLVDLASDESTEIKDLVMLSLHELEGVRVAVAGNPNTPGLAFEYLLKDTSIAVVESLAENPSLDEPYLSQILGMYLPSEDVVECLSYNKHLNLANMKMISERYPFLVKNFIDLPGVPEEIILPYFYSIEEELKQQPDNYGHVISSIINNRNTPLNILGRIAKLGVKYRLNVIEMVRISQPMIRHLNDDELLAFITD